jgi:hypothetical protein
MRQLEAQIDRSRRTRSHDSDGTQSPHDAARGTIDSGGKDIGRNNDTLDDAWRERDSNKQQQHADYDEQRARVSVRDDAHARKGDGCGDAKQRLQIEPKEAVRVGEVCGGADVNASTFRWRHAAQDGDVTECREADLKHCSQHSICGDDKATHDDDKATHDDDKATHDHDKVTHDHDKVTHDHDTVTHNDNKVHNEASTDRNQHSETDSQARFGRESGGSRQNFIRDKHENADLDGTDVRGEIDGGCMEHVDSRDGDGDDDDDDNTNDNNDDDSSKERIRGPDDDVDDEYEASQHSDQAYQGNHTYSDGYDYPDQETDDDENAPGLRRDSETDAHHDSQDEHSAPKYWRHDDVDGASSSEMYAHEGDRMAYSAHGDSRWYACDEGDDERGYEDEHGHVGVEEGSESYDGSDVCGARAHDDACHAHAHANEAAAGPDDDSDSDSDMSQ